tara:strand:+ start:175 stop:402 length:228 start_codon:yes stop_codon:yes gene_type:complete
VDIIYTVESFYYIWENLIPLICPYPFNTILDILQLRTLEPKPKRESPNSLLNIWMEVAMKMSTFTKTTTSFEKLK